MSSRGSPKHHKESKVTSHRGSLESPRKVELISVMDVAEELKKQRKSRHSVLFTVDTPIDMPHVPPERRSRVPAMLGEDDFNVQKQQLIAEMTKLEEIDKQKPLKPNVLHLHKQKSILRESENLIKQIKLLEQRKHLLKQQADDLADFTFKQKTTDRLFTRNMSQENELILGGTKPHPPTQHNAMALVRQSVIDLDRDNPNNVIEFTSKDFEYLQKTKQQQLRDVEDDLRQVKQAENKDSMALSDDLRLKWDRVKRRIRMIGRVKMVFDEVKLYGTSFRVETSEKRKEVISELESILLNRLNVIETNRKAKQSTVCLLMPDSALKILWQYVLIFLLLYTAFVTPLRLTFFDEEHVGWDTMDYVIDSLFLIDIVITLNSAYYEGNDLITSRRQITLNYLKTWFFLDILAIFPFEWVLSADSNQNINAYFKLTRIPRIYRLIRMARMIQMVKKIRHNKYVERLQEYFQLNAGIRRVLTFLCTVIVCVHIMGCFWYYAAKINDFGPQTWVHEYQLDPNDKGRLYVASIYWAVTTISTVGFGDIHAYNDLERLLSIVWMLLGAGFYSFTVGSLSSILATLDTKDAHLQNKITVTDEFCKETNLGRETRDKIRRALEYAAMKNIFSKKQRDEFLAEIPLALKFRVAEAMHSNLQAKVPFFKGKEQMFIANFVTILQPLNVTLGEIIYQKGEHPNLVYFLVHGRVNMVIGMHLVTFKTYVQGSYFGEVEIFDASPRMHTARAEVACDMLTISQQAFLAILKVFPQYYQEVRGISLEKMKRENEAIRKMQKIANLSYKSKFWQKSRTQNIYQTVKERMTPINQEVHSSESEEHSRSSVRSARSARSRRSHQKPHTSMMLPVDYRHSLIPHFDTLERPPIEFRMTQQNEHVLYAQTFTVPRYVNRANSQNFIEIRVSKYQEDSKSASQSQSRKDDPLVVQESLDDHEYLTYSEKNLHVPSSRLQTGLNMTVDQFKESPPLPALEAIQEKMVVESAPDHDPIAILTSQVTRNDETIDLLCTQLGRIQARLEKALLAPKHSTATQTDNEKKKRQFVQQRVVIRSNYRFEMSSEPEDNPQPNNNDGELSL